MFGMSGGGGMGMLLKSMGLEPEKIQEAVMAISGMVLYAKHSQDMINEKLDALAKAQNVDLSHIATMETRMAKPAQIEGNTNVV